MRILSWPLSRWRPVWETICRTSLKYQQAKGHKMECWWSSRCEKHAFSAWPACKLLSLWCKYGELFMQPGVLAHCILWDMIQHLDQGQGSTRASCQTSWLVLVDRQRWRNCNWWSWSGTPSDRFWDCNTCTGEIGGVSGCHGTAMCRIIPEGWGNTPHLW